MLKQHELVRRCFFTLMLVAIYIMGQQVLLPGIRPDMAHQLLQQNNFLRMVGIAVGGRLTLPTLFSLGIGPYMTAMIIWQALVSLEINTVNRLSIRQAGYVRKFITLVVAMIQSQQLFWYLSPSLAKLDPWGIGDNATFIIGSLILTAGAMLAAGIAEFNNEFGIGGTVALIIPGVVVNLPQALTRGWGGATLHYSWWMIGLTLVVTFVTLYIGTWFNQAECRIPVQRPMLLGDYQNSYIPIRLLTAGAMPFMFSSVLFTLPRQLIKGTAFSQTAGGRWLMLATSYHEWIGIITYGIIISVLGYVFGMINVRPTQIAKQLKESGDYILNVLSGDETEQTITHHFLMMTTAGNLFLTLLALIPLIIGMFYTPIANFSLYIGNLMILITVTDSTIQQVKALYVKHHYALFAD